MTERKPEPKPGPMTDVVGTWKAKKEWKLEKKIQEEEVKILRQRLRECTQREFTNSIQRCKKEAIEYYETLHKYKKGLKLSSTLY